MALREYAGAAKRTALSGDITAASTTISVADATGYPTGATGPFAIALSLGTAAEEKVLITSRSGNTLTVNTRGYDGTTAAAHSSGSNVDHVLTAIDVREANTHINATTGAHPATAISFSPAAGVAATTVQAAIEEVVSDASAAYAPIGAKSVRAYRTTTQSIPNTTATAVQFDAEDFDTSSFHDNATNNTRLTVPAGEAGKYLVAGSISMFGTAGSYREVSIRVNGATIVGITNLPPGEFGRFPFACVCGLSAGQYVEVYVAQNSGGALNVNSGSSESFVTLTKIGA